jgi:hypothetical protein
MSGGWICVEWSPSPADDESSDRTFEAVVRLARALDTTVDELLLRLPDWWLASDPAAGQTMALDRRECRRLLESEGIGRVGFVGPDGPSVLPVNYLFSDGRVIFRTAPRSPLARLNDAAVCFEVDGIDHEQRTGWSVLATGRARTVLDPAGELGCGRPHSWAGGERDIYVVIGIERITGRRVGAAALAG